MNRRGFLGSMLALGAAPAVVRADSLMRIVPPKAFILWGDGFHDDTQAFQALVSGRPVVRRDIGYTEPGSDGAIGYLGGVYRLNGTIFLPALSMTINSVISETGVAFVSPQGRMGIGT